MARRKWNEKEVRKYQEEHNSTFYFNKQDTNIFVKKYKQDFLPTFNFANPMAWIIILVIFILCVGIMFFANRYLIVN